jgi:tetratricopeptide (TPR) repeat protein
MYDNVMNKFKWGGVDKPGIYLDENTMRMCKSYRGALFGELASALMYEGKRDRALAVLDRAMQVLPPDNVPCDYSAFMIGDLYLHLGEREKGEQILNNIANGSMRTIRWLFRFSPDKLPYVQQEIERQLRVMQNVITAGLRTNPDFGLAYRDEYNNYRMAYTRQTQTEE